MGIFADQVNIWTTYTVTLQFRDKVMGGVPKNPRIMAGWLRTRMKLEEDAAELRQVMVRILRELGAEVHERMTFDELDAAAEALAAVKQTNGFKQNAAGLYVEGRCIKAMLKEATNVMFAGERWGVTRKGPKAFVAERVFVDPDAIPLGMVEPSGVELFIGHTTGPKGPQSNLTYHEYAARPCITCQVRALRDELTADQWASLWTYAEENGFGALRSQGYGRFDVVGWEQVPTPTPNGRVREAVAR